MEQLRNPMFAAVFAGAVTAGYLYFKAHINNEAKLSTSAYMKPALLNAILVYFIISYGCGQRERILTEPF